MQLPRVESSRRELGILTLVVVLMSTVAARPLPPRRSVARAAAFTDSRAHRWNCDPLVAAHQGAPARSRVRRAGGGTRPASRRHVSVGQRRDVPAEHRALRDVGGAVSATPLVLQQVDERFTPHVLPVRVGATVQFPNADPIYHNVFSLSSAATFDLGRFAAGTSKSVTFTRTGVAQVFCHIHADMSAYVLVLDHPFFVIPDANGHFVLDGVPPGDYQLMAWHERIKPFATNIRVDANRTTSVRVLVPLPEDGK